jgi:predicted dehydrogenase
MNRHFLKRVNAQNMNRQIDVAVLGLGMMGATHVGAAKASPYVRTIYGYEPDPARAALRGKELGVKATSDLDSILTNPEVKLIYIASINSVHAEQAIMALRARKAVLCEKPMAEDIEGARALIAAAKETGQFLQIGFELHYSKLYTTAKEWIDQGRIGTVVNTQCRYYCSEFHLKNSWRSNSKGSLIGEKLSHYLDLQRWFTGSPVEEVFSMAAPNVVEYFNHPDNHQISMRFKNGAISHLNFAMYIAESDHGDPLLDMLDKQSDDGHFLQYHIFGTNGAIETDVFRRRVRRWEFTDSPDRLVSKIAETVTYEKQDDNQWIHNTHGQNVRIAELVACGLPPETPADDSFETMRVGFAAEISEKEKRIVCLGEL